jgi:hypothetical protein
MRVVTHLITVKAGSIATQALYKCVMSKNICILSNLVGGSVVDP